MEKLIYSGITSSVTDERSKYIVTARFYEDCPIEDDNKKQLIQPLLNLTIDTYINVGSSKRSHVASIDLNFRHIAPETLFQEIIPIIGADMKIAMAIFTAVTELILHLQFSMRKLERCDYRAFTGADYDIYIESLKHFHRGVHAMYERHLLDLKINKL